MPRRNLDDLDTEDLLINLSERALLRLVGQLLEALARG